MPNTDREHLEAIVAAQERYDRDASTGDIRMMVSKPALDATLAAAKHHIASTPDTGSDGAAEVWERVDELQTYLSALDSLDNSDHRHASCAGSVAVEIRELVRLRDAAIEARGRAAVAPPKGPDGATASDKANVLGVFYVAWLDNGCRIWSSDVDMSGEETHGLLGEGPTLAAALRDVHISDAADCNCAPECIEARAQEAAAGLENETIRGTTPTPSPPIPDSDLKRQAGVPPQRIGERIPPPLSPELIDALHIGEPTPDTGGVEGPEFTYGKDKRTDDWVLWLNGSEIARAPDGWWGEPDKPLSIRNDATLAFCLAAFSEGHKAGASGSGFGVLAKELSDAIAALAAPIGRARLVLGEHESSAAIGEAFDQLRKVEGRTLAASLENPASGSDEPTEIRTEHGVAVEIADRSHAENWGGNHRKGFCPSCALTYLAAQHTADKFESAASGSDGLKKATKDLLSDLDSFAAQMMDKTIKELPRTTLDSWLNVCTTRQILAAALSDGGMGDE